MRADHPWHPDVLMEPERARALVVAQFPEFAGAPVESLGKGWDNTAFLIGQAVFRFPRRTIAAALMDTEVRVLPRLADVLPVRIPRPTWAGSPTVEYPWPFVGYPCLDGAPLTDVVLPPGASRSLAVTLGAFLRVLHGQDPRLLDLRPDPVSRLELDGRRGLLTERLNALAEAGLVRDPGRWLGLFEPPIPRPGNHRVPVHGDLYARHILVTGEGDLCGVIDWGDVHAGDPASDLAAGWWLFPAVDRAAFMRAYGPVAEESVRLARLRATFHAASTAWYAHSEGDAPLLRASLEALVHVLDA